MTQTFPSYGEIFDAINDLDSNYLRFYESLLIPDKAFLELGCGTGRLLLPLAYHVPHAYGTDRDASALDRAASKVASAGLTGRVTLSQEDFIVSRVPTDVGLVFFSCDTLTLAPTAEQRFRILRNLTRKILPDTRILLNFTNPLGLFSPRHREIYRVGAVDDLRIEVRENRYTSVQDMVQRCTKETTVAQANGRAQVRSQDRDLGIVTFSEIQIIAAACELQITRTWGGYDGQPLALDSPKVIVELQRFA